MENNNSNIIINQNLIKKKEIITNSKYSIINNENEIIQGIEISKDNKLFSSNNNNKNIITLNIDSSFIEKSSNKFLYKKKGNTFQFFGNSNGDALIIIGPHWYMIIIVIILITYIFYSILKTFWIYSNIIIIIIGFIIYFIFLFSYLITALINPGFPKNEKKILNNEIIKKDYDYCDICLIYTKIESKTIHCQMCDICIEEFDHHCPWTSKCIGKRNIFYFYIFIGSIFTLMFYFFVVALTANL